jgi:hypothetical protein
VSARSRNADVGRFVGRCLLAKVKPLILLGYSR